MCFFLVAGYPGPHSVVATLLIHLLLFTLNNKVPTEQQQMA